MIPRMFCQILGSHQWRLECLVGRKCMQKLDVLTCGVHTTASQQQDTGVVSVFDRHTKLLQRERAAASPDVKLFDYIKEQVGYTLADRIHDIKREFKVGLDLGCGRGHVAKNVDDTCLQHLHMGDISPSMLSSAYTPEGIGYTKTVMDEELPLPFENKSMDLVISGLSLHWVNNLPGCLQEIYRILKEDGVFLGAMFGGDTLYELRSSLVLAELEREGGFASHISPFTEIRDIGGLLNQAGFTMLTVDTNEIVVGFPSLFELLWDLQGMAENNASHSRKLHLHRDTLLAAAAIYKEMYGKGDGIPATFQVIYMIGWKPDPKQEVAQSQRGSGQISMKDIHKLNERIREAGMEGRINFMDELASKDSDKDRKD